jgi:hypothetical protein
MYNSYAALAPGVLVFIGFLAGIAACILVRDLCDWWRSDDV